MERIHKRIPRVIEPPPDLPIVPQKPRDQRESGHIPAHDVGTQKERINERLSDRIYTEKR